jgi:hypothetical protein
MGQRKRGRIYIFDIWRDELTSTSSSWQPPFARGQRSTPTSPLLRSWKIWNLRYRNLPLLLLI